MPLKAADWHKRFTQQAGWTASSRQYLFNLAGITVDSLLLDLGCGTGAIAADLAATASRQPVGIDTSTEFLALAANHVPDGRFVNGDGHELPFMQAAFDACYCHYVLMWVKEPLLVLQEMARVTKPGAAVLALAEPDYGGRIDFPPGLEPLKQLQTAGLEQLGADPVLGRKLKGLFHRAGFVDITAGIIGAQWTSPPSQEDIDSEWKIIQHDLEALGNEKSELSTNSEEMQMIDRDAWRIGERILYVPTFYALGRVPLD
jgi:ubiquinone/menaquinone biosynthesis C-methylase UbiE